ncbi:hypothetical protein L226DRAFT_573616 [Lentinus tigrinus ALCF2SS1-7]|uniref:F-box domain-containing protein n=1 Tax=Lentinus tigrinus ALCF2SS1-6 TaxID=1328759 RepID=A0A5C2S2G1_9APHY|nr:hypothetical protein L227DRAFT_613384 [Lentinus tigrinus ALCF2SS1-6]RPD71954.1 hypothetical protein L226DRAFT_573616 [Lentinus tigrinus ALCF2SS1-7]
MEDRHPITRPPRLSIELCEHVIDAVYDYYYQFIVESLATLSKCTLVCRAWRPRAQMMLFESVLIGDTAKLHRFAALLDDSPRLREYVHRLALRGYLHIPASPAVLFPTIMRLRLPNLTHLYLQDITSKEKLETSLPKGVKELPSVPVHPYFPSLLSTFNHVRRLDLVRIRFCSFGDLCRVLSGLSGLPELSCDNVSWQVFGTLPPGVLKAISNAHPRKPFLSKLRTLNCYDMDEKGRATLVASLGPSVSDLSFTSPNTYLPELPRHRGHTTGTPAFRTRRKAC